MKRSFRVGENSWAQEGEKLFDQRWLRSACLQRRANSPTLLTRFRSRLTSDARLQTTNELMRMLSTLEQLRSSLSYSLTFPVDSMFYSLQFHLLAHCRDDHFSPRNHRNRIRRHCCSTTYGNNCLWRNEKFPWRRRGRKRFSLSNGFFLLDWRFLRQRIRCILEEISIKVRLDESRVTVLFHQFDDMFFRFVENIAETQIVEKLPRKMRLFLTALDCLTVW